MNSILKLKILKIFLWITGILIFFWWPLSHWLYSDFYHQILGFAPGSYQDSMVKIIGTIGITPVLLIIFSAIDPVKNKHMVITLMIFFVLLSFTYIYLILSNQFPVLEYINACLCLFFVLIVSILYPWKMKN